MPGRRALVQVSLGGAALVWMVAAQQPARAPLRGARQAIAEVAPAFDGASRAATAQPDAGASVRELSRPAPAQRTPAALPSAPRQPPSAPLPPPRRPEPGREANAPIDIRADAVVEEPDEQESSRQQLITSWSEEPEDEDWTAELSTYLNGAFADTGRAGQVLEVACRTTLCRALLRFNALSEAASFDSEAGSQDALRQVFLHPADGDHIEVEVFVPRREPSQ